MLPSNFAYHQRPNSSNLSVDTFVNTQNNQRYDIQIKNRYR